MLDKQPYSPFFGLYYIYNIYLILSINYTISIHDDSFLVKAKKTQTYLLCERSSVWAKFLLYVKTVVTLSYTIPNSWNLMIGYPFGVSS